MLVIVSTVNMFTSILAYSTLGFEIAGVSCLPKPYPLAVSECDLDIPIQDYHPGILLLTIVLRGFMPGFGFIVHIVLDMHLPEPEPVTG